MTEEQFKTLEYQARDLDRLDTKALRILLDQDIREMKEAIASLKAKSIARHN